MGISEETQEVPGEAPYRPYSTANDELVRVKASPANSGAFERLARESRKETAFLKTRLFQVFRALEPSGTEHGVRTGRKVSGRMLVNTYCEIRGGDKPSRPYMEVTPQVDMSLASAIVIDESSSMRDKLAETTAIAYALMDSLEAIGSKTIALGFRSKYSGHQYPTRDEMPTQCHRTHAMAYDLFKDWSERFKDVAPRLKEIRADGGTPMSDGVEFALRELSTRQEGYRVLFVLTDGAPDGGHAEVIRSQIKRAEAAGVMLIGIGLGYGSEYVKRTFKDFVYEKDLKAIPKALITKLEQLIRTTHPAAKRGRGVQAA